MTDTGQTVNWIVLICNGFLTLVLLLARGDHSRCGCLTEAGSCLFVCFNHSLCLYVDSRFLVKLFQLLGVVLGKSECSVCHCWWWCVHSGAPWSLWNNLKMCCLVLLFVRECNWLNFIHTPMSIHRDFTSRCILRLHILEAMDWRKFDHKEVFP